MNKIIYPTLNKNKLTFGVTAPSSGVEAHLKILMDEAKKNVEKLGHHVIFGDTVWTQNKGRSSSIAKRVSELEEFLERADIDIIMPPWGGNFLMEILPQINWEFIKQLPPKWIIGYSDTSTLLFIYTTRTGIATAHGLNFSELSAPRWDEASQKFLDVLKCQPGDSMIQHSSKEFQSSWTFAYQNPAQGFNFDCPTQWKSININNRSRMQGRLIGGCLNTLQVLIGTPFDHLKSFVANYCPEGTIFYLESVGMDAANIYRALWQMKHNQWFNHCNGILIGRAGTYEDAEDFTLEDALKDTFIDLNIPVFYDVDIGHMPPQLTLINGAMADVTIENGKGSLKINLA